MLTLEGCLARRQRLWDMVPAAIDWLLIADPRHIKYLANFWVQPLSFSGGERGLLLLERDGRTTLLADNFAFRAAASAPYVDREVITTWYDHQHSVVNRDHALFKSLSDIAGELRGRKGLVEAEWLPLGATALLDPSCYEFSANQEAGASVLTDLGTILRSLRTRKDPDELDLLRLCMKAGAAGQARLLEVVQEGVDEFTVFCEVQKAAVTGAGLPAIVYGDFRACSAEHPKNGGLPKAGGHTLQKGETFILDYSVMIEGYRSDFTNTVSVGTPKPEVQELFDVCKAAMAAGESVLRSGVSAAEVYRAVAQPIHDAGHPKAFTHHAGHGLGLAHPEPPILVPRSTDTLQSGNVITLEPGAYVEGIGGIRIEHNYLITDQGYERLSHHEIRLT